MPGPTAVRVEPATRERWEDVVAAFGSRASRDDSCWCQRFRAADERCSNRERLRREIDETDPPVGLLAWAGEEPAGWTRVVPRDSLPGIAGNRALQRIVEPDERAWWVACFAVHQAHRRTGVATALLAAAVHHARSNGGSVLQGHPVDVERLAARSVGGSALFTGTLSLFAAAGFVEIGRTYPSRPVMQLPL